MPSPPGSYTFLPWVRQGLSNAINESETTPNGALRPSIDLQLTIQVVSLGDPITPPPLNRSILLYGPGDVLGIDRQAIIKTEPRDWITNFEPNHLAHIEFYDEDFPWRYTPAQPDTLKHRQRPWIALVALQENEFIDGEANGAPLPFIDISDFSKLPVKDELWAWAHVHVNRNLGADESVILNSEGTTIASRLQSVLSENPDLAYSRVLCPRRLTPNTAYHVFLIPTFETGRVAGLGLDVGKVDDAMRGAWEPHSERGNLSGSRFPYYYRWYFRTGNAVDFESLVRLLKPRSLDARVGRRDMDVQRPGGNLSGIAGPDGNGVLRLGGALMVPDEGLSEEEITENRRFEAWDSPRPHPFQRGLAAFVNLADEYATKSAEEAHQGGDMPPGMGELPDGNIDPDPLITPPLYGRWHALTQRLLTERDGTTSVTSDNWVHTLNLDPRHRVAAGLGTKVVRSRQDDYMEAAWKQVGAVLEANRRLRLAQWGKAVSQAWFAKHLAVAGSPPAEVLALTAPLAGRVLLGGLTLRKRVGYSPVPQAMIGSAMRRLLRPGGRIGRSLRRIDAHRMRSADASTMIERLNAGTLTSAQAPTAPSGAATVAELSRFLSSAIPAPVNGFASRYPYSMPSDLLRPEAEALAAVDALPVDSAFTLTTFGAPIRSRATGSDDNVQARRFKSALRSELQAAKSAAAVHRPAVRTPLDLATTAEATLAQIDPARTFVRRFHQTVFLPDRIKEGLQGDLVEVMTYPRIDEPMYRPLAELGSELFLPNVGLIPPNSVTMLQANQAFIESYMVGLNHEFARELLWREYPTDQRGSYFRQFWDVSGYLEDGDLSPEDLREKMFDIPKLHLWSITSSLGQHDNRQPPGSQPKKAVVLAIRGELLKRYPTAVIYAHRADWQRTNGAIDKSLIRVPVELSDAELDSPPREKVKTPLYEAKVEPDITFLGFDLTVSQARGNPDTDDPGWFFVIKERPGEPRFGFDIGRDEGAPINTWSDLVWDDVTTENELLRINSGMSIHQLTTPPPASEGPEELAQHLDDKQVLWNADTNAAGIAYVLYQLPVLIAVHAAEMLPEK